MTQRKDIMADKTLSHDEHDALDRRISRTEDELSTLVAVTSKQGEQLASVVTSLNTIGKQVGSLFNRSDRPTQWGAIVAAISLTIMVMTLALAPIISNIMELKSFDKIVMRHLERDAYEMGVHDTEIAWLKKMEDRLNERIHKTLKD